MRIAVTGAGGRLGHALLATFGESPFAGPSGAIGWDRRQLDLDDPARIERLLDQGRVELLVHAAAWTDVDACARDPDLANVRNGHAVGVIAAACASRGIDLVLVSTNEVFDGRRTDGRGYRADDAPNPINAYGASKLAGEIAATDAYGHGADGGSLAIVRTAWLFGPPGNDFPSKILAAAGRAATDGAPLRVVRDEIGSPTYAPDLAEAIAELIGSGAIAGKHHLVNAGTVSRAGWARELLARAGLDVPIEEIELADWPRPSIPPRWAVLEPTNLPSGEAMRPWQEALADYLPDLRRRRAIPTGQSTWAGG